MSEQDDGGVEQIPVGDCPNCGVIAGDSVSWNFPAPATCGLCEIELNAAAMAPKKEAKQFE